jgi:hypothetical protein
MLKVFAKLDWRTVLPGRNEFPHNTPTLPRRIVLLLFLLVPLLAMPVVGRARGGQDYGDIIIQDQIMKNLIRKRAAETRRRNARARQQQTATRAQQSQRRSAKARKKAQT